MGCLSYGNECVHMSSALESTLSSYWSCQEKKVCKTRIKNRPNSEMLDVLSRCPKGVPNSTTSFIDYVTLRVDKDAGNLLEKTKLYKQSV